MKLPVIRIENVSKSFNLRHQIGQPYQSIRDKFDESVSLLFGSKKRDLKHEEFWALSGVTFDIFAGDRIGIIGRNGAGKSTLLKILSRIIEPTAGSVKISGRVASLLEVGTGFHPELTGRENIYLNGAILGMSRNEIKSKFDEIVSFAEVEKFLDTPVKRYSSGMYVRLAFAVAAHLEPEILVIDEVLAVGDAAFQKKCLGKMENVSKNGRTILFVSHNMGSVLQLCNKCVLLQDGKLVHQGSTQDVIDQYIENKQADRNLKRRFQGKNVNQFVKISPVDSEFVYRSEFLFDELIQFDIELFLPNFNQSLELAMRLIDKYSRAVFTIHEPLSKYYSNSDILKLKVTLPQKFLTPGKYSWTVCINHPGVEMFDVNEDICPFELLESGSEFARYSGADYGVVFSSYKIEILNA